MIQHQYQIQMKLTAVSTLLLLCVAGGVAQFDIFDILFPIPSLIGHAIFPDSPKRSPSYGMVTAKGSEEGAIKESASSTAKIKTSAASDITAAKDPLTTVLSSDLQLSLSAFPQNLAKGGSFQSMGNMQYPEYIPVFIWVGDTEPWVWRFHDGAELGPGRVYNKNWKDTTVAELATDRDISVSLWIEQKPGSYYLSFDWAAREGVAFSSSQIELRWNGNLFSTLIPFSLQLNAQPMVFQLSGSVANLTLTGAGDKDTLGATVSNVKLYEIRNHFKGGFSDLGYYRYGNQIYSRNRFIGLQNLLIIFDFAPSKQRQPSESGITVILNNKPLVKLVPDSHRPRREFLKAKLIYYSVYILRFEGSKGEDVLGDRVTNLFVFQQPQFVEGRYQLADFLHF